MQTAVSSECTIVSSPESYAFVDLLTYLVNDTVECNKNVFVAIKLIFLHICMVI